MQTRTIIGLGALGSFFLATLAAFGLGLPQLVTKTDLTFHNVRHDKYEYRVAQDINANKRFSLEQAIESTDLRAIRVRQAIGEARKADLRTTDLEAEQRILERRIRKYEAELRSMPNN